MNGPVQQAPSIDQLIVDPAKVAAVTPETAQALLIGLASIQPLLIQRALMGVQNGKGDNGLLTVPEVAARLKLSPYRVYELARQGQLKTVRLGKSVRVKPEDVSAYIAQQGG